MSKSRRTWIINVEFVEPGSLIFQNFHFSNPFSAAYLVWIRLRIWWWCCTLLVWLAGKLTSKFRPCCLWTSSSLLKDPRCTLPEIQVLHSCWSLNQHFFIIFLRFCWKLWKEACLQTCKVSFLSNDAFFQSRSHSGDPGCISALGGVDFEGTVRDLGALIPHFNVVRSWNRDCIMIWRNLW